MEPSIQQNTLHRRRAELRARGSIAELVLPVQQAIVAEARATGQTAEVASAYNYLSVILLRLGQPRDAEVASRAALRAYAGVAAPSAEAVGCYEYMLARALAAQGRFEVAEAGYRHYAVFHDPPDDFLAARAGELAALRRGEGPAPLEW